MLKENFVKFISDSIRDNHNMYALSDYQGEKFKYSDIGNMILRLHKLFDELGIKEGDHIALLGKNSARWGATYLAVVSYGAVIVPILPDFKPDNLHEIISHSDSIFLFADEALFEKLEMEKIPEIKASVSITDFSLMHSQNDQIAEKISSNGWQDLNFDFANNSFALKEVPNEKLAVISYTSGTTGFTKGVMIHHNSLAANIRYAQTNMPLNAGDPLVSFLPLAHTFGCAFEFLFPFTLGCDITILTKTPSPQIILKAFGEIKPALILSIPLVVEKIFKKQILPIISKSSMKVLLVIPGLKNVILNKIKAKLEAAFGGNFNELVIGGAPLNQEAEHFFKKMKFRFTVGYGMTECGPLISYAPWTTNPIGSSGKSVDTLEMKIDSSDPEKIAGEIMVRGDNVMLGYYKNEESTKAVLEDDGWLHTGDLGLLIDGFVHIKGRSKSMILGPSGKNIYPEELESIINNLTGVHESLVVQRDDKLVALVYADKDFVDQHKMDNEKFQKHLDHHKKHINHKLPSFMNISKMVIQKEEFVKTPKRNIKRFLYS